MDETSARILLVDDDVRLRELLVRYLESQGFDVRGVGDGAQMRQALDRGHFDLIVLDLMLPGENGPKTTSPPSGCGAPGVGRVRRSTERMRASSSRGFTGLGT